MKVKKKPEKQQCSKLFKTVVRNKEIQSGSVRHYLEDQKFGIPTQNHHVREEKKHQTKPTLNRWPLCQVQQTMHMEWCCGHQDMENWTKKLKMIKSCVKRTD